ncbi:Os04g0568751, partial [Oryza sativa Japonica Group]
ARPRRGRRPHGQREHVQIRQLRRPPDLPLPHGDPPRRVPLSLLVVFLHLIVFAVLVSPFLLLLLLVFPVLLARSFAADRHAEQHRLHVALPRFLLPAAVVVVVPRHEAPHAVADPPRACQLPRQPRVLSPQPGVLLLQLGHRAAHPRRDPRRPARRRRRHRGLPAGARRRGRDRYRRRYAPRRRRPRASGPRPLPPLYPTEQVLLPSPEAVVGELPPIRHHLLESVGVELAHEGGEVAVLEVLGEEVAGELGGAPHHEGRAGVVPRDGLIGARVLHHRVRLRQERRRPRRRR